MLIYGAWLIGLGWLAWTSPDPVISRPQFQAASAVIVGRVIPDGAGGWQVRVLERIKPSSAKAWQELQRQLFQPIHVAPTKPPTIEPAPIQLGQPEAVEQAEEYLRVANIEQAQGWQGSGDYVLPLALPPGSRAWHIAPLPQGPGMFGLQHPIRRIYPNSASVRRQLQKFAREFQAIE
jgi:hypothetical protein